MTLEIRPGADPGDPAAIRICVGDDVAENVKIVEAYNDRGRKRALVLIEYDEAAPTDQKQDAGKGRRSSR